MPGDSRIELNFHSFLCRYYKIILSGMVVSFVTFLIALGISLYVVTYNTIPWAPNDMKRAEINAVNMNDILWQFDKPGVYTIRSTEYSAPAGVDMLVKDAVIVSDDETVQNNEQTNS